MTSKIFFKTVSIMLALVFPSYAQVAKSENHSDSVISRIAFGSCYNPRDRANGMFEAILVEKPDAFIFLGDNIYGDTEDMEVLKKKYSELAVLEGFQKLRKQCKIIATWDDHDYGVNDGGNEYPMRKESEKVFLDFFQEPKGTARRQRPGVYTSYTFGTEGKTVQVLLLDTRYFRDKLARVAYEKGKKPEGVVGWYTPTKDTSMRLLGEEQWKWLEQQLQVPADLRIIASSIQMLAVEKGMENWSHVPHEFDRLIGLLKKYKVNHTIAISGDVHFAELSKKTINGYPFYDMTSSGMTNARPVWANAKNSFRIGEACSERNAGMIDIDWSNKSVTLRAINKEAKTVIQHKIPFAELQFR